MTKELLAQMRVQTTLSMEKTLTLSKHLNTHLSPFVTVHKYIVVDIMKVDSTERVKELTEQINTTLTFNPSAIVETEPITKTEYCSTKYMGTKYIIKIPQFIERLDKSHIDKVMMGYLKVMLKLGVWDKVECQVMKLFKQGDITWEQVKEAHSVACSL